MATIDPDKIINLGKSPDEEFNGPEESKVFFPGMSLDAGMIPGEVGTKMFLKVMVEKTSASKSPGKDHFDLQSMRILGLAEEPKEKMDIDKALEIVIAEKRIVAEPKGDLVVTEA